VDEGEDNFLAECHVPEAARWSPVRIGGNDAGGWLRREKKRMELRVERSTTLRGREDVWLLGAGEEAVNDPGFGREGRGVHDGVCEIPMVANPCLVEWRCMWRRWWS
jgi:hypothetical protein